MDPSDRPAAGRRSAELRSAAVAARAEATRAALISSARKLFVEKGYFDTSVEEIVVAAGVGTRGALYHHFADKRALFHTVLEAVENEMLAETAASLESAAPEGALDLLKAGLMGFLDASMNPEVQRIVLIDGRAVLGWREWRILEEGYGLGALRNLLKSAISEGSLADRPVDALAHLVFALIDEAALYVANSPDPRAAKIEAVAAVDQLLAGLSRS